MANSWERSYIRHWHWTGIKAYNRDFHWARSQANYQLKFQNGEHCSVQWYYYVRQRDRPEEWKCQPTKWLSPELERHEILLGGFSLLLGSIVSGFLSCYISNGGWTRIYYDISEYGWLWDFLQFPVTFIWQVSTLRTEIDDVNDKTPSVLRLR